MHSQSLPFATIKHRFISLVYEAVLLFAVAFVLAIIVTFVEYQTGVLQPKDLSSLFIVSGWVSWVVQLFYFFCIGCYFTYCWFCRGQTLAMKSWRIKLVSRDDTPLTWKRLWWRYFWAVSLFPINFIWVFFDRDHQFLHDRWVRTALVSIER